MERSRGMPSRVKNAAVPASEPAIDAVCEIVAARDCSERPTVIATTGLPSSRARNAIASKRATSSIPSTCSPTAVTRLSSSSPSAISDKPGLRLVAGRADIGDRQAAPLHGHVDGHVRALRDDRHAALDAHAAMLVRPEQRAVEIVDEAVAVRPEDRHVAGRLDERRLQRRAVLRLAEAGGVADRPARAALGKRAHDLHRQLRG